MGSVSDEQRQKITSDPFCELLGIEFESIEPGEARTRLTVEERHLNFRGMLHGGVVFSLADAAFSAVGNTGGISSVALEANISFLAPVESGDTVVAEARESHSTPRTAQVELTVRKKNGTRVATVRGRSYKT